MSSSHNQLIRIAREYRELNGTLVEIHHGPPSPLEFAKIVNLARPVVFKGCFSPSTLPALSKWSDEYLVSTMHDQAISVAVTPDGRADALKLGPDGSTIYFVEPCTQQIPFRSFFQSLQSQSRIPSIAPGEVCYLQSQNGNLSDSKPEFPVLKEDVPDDIHWATHALGRKPEAVNLWIGDSRSTTSIHSDPYENIYTIVRGQKHFTLLPPTEGWTLKEKLYPHATYTRQSPSSPVILTPSSDSDVSWASIDPITGKGAVSVSDDNSVDGTDFRKYARPINVTLSEPGDALYLPACWWHHVRQGQRHDDANTVGGPDVTIALNWWYDMEMRGSNWVWYSFLRGRLSGELEGRGDADEESGEESDM